MRRALDIVYDWCREQILFISLNKTIEILLSNTRNLDEIWVITIDGKSVKFSREVKYLGVSIRYNI